MNTESLLPHKKASMSNKKLYFGLILGLLWFCGTLALVKMTFHSASDLRAYETLNSSALRDLFEHWKLVHDKTFSTESEELLRFKNFQYNYHYIQAWNSDPTNTATLGLTQFADLTLEEFSALLGSKPALDESFSTHKNPFDYQNTEALPAAVNWLAQGAVTAVQTQGQCASDWAFSATGAMEGIHFIQGKTLFVLSAQQIMDCANSFGGQGCNGGWPSYSYEYAKQYGLEAAAQYPYTQLNGKCKYNADFVEYQIHGFTNVTTNNETALAYAVAQQPITSYVNGASPAWQLYTGGVISGTACGTDKSHSILIVGYNETMAGQQYWNIKNSWGPGWGLQGYAWVAKNNNTNTPGTCGIAAAPLYPNNGSSLINE
jgi:hypothetical protein